MAASARDTPGAVVDLAEFDRLRSLGVRIVVADVRWYLDGRDGRKEYASGHIPGSVFVDIDRDLSQPGSAVAGRHPLPDPDSFSTAMGALGIGDDTWVVAYDDTGGMTAARLVVMLRMLGRAASLLDGGLAAWTAVHPDEIERGAMPPKDHANFTPTPWPSERIATTEQVESCLGSRTILLDARSPERFRGDENAIDTRFGHIPGAYNSPWASLVVDGHLKSIPELRRHYSALGVDEAPDVVAYCGSGVSACLNVLAMEHAGLTPARLYPPSWSGWTADGTHECETGDVIPDPARHHEGRSAFAALRDLRRTRQRHRLAELEWFEALYRVYLAAFVYGGGILFVSDLVKGDPVSEQFVADALRFGAGWLGIAATMAFAFGLRSGSRGGPLALEDADVRHALLAPIDRRRALLRPAVQRLRAVCFATTAIGALAGQLAGRRFPGSEVAWAAGGALWGLAIGLLSIGGALVAHAVRTPRWLATALGGALIVWQGVSAPRSSVPGPADAIGGLALWGERARVIELVGLAVAVVIGAIGLVLLGRQSLEALSRRSALVTQLRFAVTVQDLRTVMLLRRQLAHEQSRRRPWVTISRSARGVPELRRTAHGLLRYPTTRVFRVVMATAAAGAAAAGTLDGSTPLVAASGVLLFVVGLELLEPLAQEIDHGERTDSYPRERGPSFLRLTYASLITAVPCALIFALAASVVDRRHGAVVAIVALPALLAGLAGAAINVVSGAPDPLASSAQNTLMPPEVAGTMNVMRALWPVAVSTLGQIPLVIAQHAERNGRSVQAAAARTTIAIVLLVGIIGAWIHRRDAIKAWFAQAARESKQGAT